MAQSFGKERAVPYFFRFLVQDPTHGQGPTPKIQIPEFPSPRPLDPFKEPFKGTPIDPFKEPFKGTPIDPFKEPFKGTPIDPFKEP